MPFAFRFINTDYPSGTTIRVTTDGYISFSSSSLGSSTGDFAQYYDYYGYYYLYNGGATTPSYAKTIMPFAGGLATSIGSGDGGVYYKVEGTTPNRVLTFEW